MTPTHRRWRHQPRLIASDVVVWAVVIALVAGTLVGLCVALTLVVPS